jgi:hypothetical protein
VYRKARQEENREDSSEGLFNQEKVMTKYENPEGYPPYDEGGKYTVFGYPADMLHMAVARDDVTGFRFYFDRYFNLDCEVWSNKYKTSLLEYTEKAPKVKAELERMMAERVKVAA